MQHPTPALGPSLSSRRFFRGAAALAAALLTLALPAAAHAEEGGGPSLELRGQAGAGAFGGHSLVGARVAWPSRLALSLNATGAYGTWFVGGKESDRATTTGGHLTLELPLASDGPRHLAFRSSLGARTTGAAGLPGDPRSFVVTTEIGVRGTAEVGDRAEVYLGVGAPIALAVRPEVEIEELGQWIELGTDVWLSRRVALSASARAGGDYGYNGDGPKTIVQGTLGVRVAFDDRPGPRAVTPRSPSSVGVFVASEWRALGLAEHLSHGPAFAAGVSLFGRHLKLGLVAVTRPGALNGETFPTSTVGGKTYRGRQRFDLRSDGGFIGVLVAPSFELPFAPRVSVEVPFAIGQSAYGFYLPGNERATPDGRRVSAWENELFGGKDSSPALGIEAGLKVGVKLPFAEWIAPYGALRYTWSLGFDTLVRSSYDGPSAALGLEMQL